MHKVVRIGLIVIIAVIYDVYVFLTWKYVVYFFFLQVKHQITVSGFRD